jgi:hypothetical protein
LRGLRKLSERQIQEGGFQTRPYQSRFFLRPLRSLRPFFFSIAASLRRVFVVKSDFLIAQGNFA